MKLSIILAGLCLAFVSTEASAQLSANQKSSETVSPIPSEDNSKIKSESSDVLVYPNPATNALNLSWENDVEMIELTDAKGELLNRFYVDTMKDLKINLSMYPNGIYFIHVTDGTGVSVHNIVKE